MEGESVKVHIYDLSKGMARSMSRALLGKQIDGIWHTGIVVFGQEFYFGGLGGIESCNPGGLQMLGPPDNIVEVGKTQIPFEVFMDHLQELATTTFRGECYHLLNHNCNTFSNELAKFLTGNPIPSYITSLPEDVMSTPFGAMIKPFIDSMQVNPGGHQMFPQTAGNSASQNNTTHSTTTNRNSENQFFPKTTYLSFDTANIKAIVGKLKELADKAPTELQERVVLLDQLQGLAEGKENRIEQLNTLSKILQWPSGSVSSNSTPVPHLSAATFWDDKVCDTLVEGNQYYDNLTTPDKKLVTEIKEYLTTDECSWAPGRPHLQLIGSLLEDPSTSHVISVRLLQNMCTREDVVTQLQMDPVSQAILHSVLSKFEEFSAELQEHLLKTLCNLTQRKTYLTSLSKQSNSSNNKPTLTRLFDLCKDNLLATDKQVTTSVASALCYNLLQTELNEDIICDLGMALVQVCSQELQSAYVKYGLYSLYTCMRKNREVTSLAAVMDLSMDQLSSNDSNVDDVKKQINLSIKKAKQ